MIPDAAHARLTALEMVTRLDTTEDAAALTLRLLALGAFPREASADAAHVSIAATNRVDYLLTWNFRHIANARCAFADRASVPKGWLRTARHLHAQRTHGGVRPCRRDSRTQSSLKSGPSGGRYAARFAYDVEAIFKDIRARQEASGREYVRLPGSGGPQPIGRDEILESLQPGSLRRHDDEPVEAPRGTDLTNEQVRR